MFDGDFAGQEATFKNWRTFTETWIKCICSTITKNMDPDEYIVKFGKKNL